MREPLGPPVYSDFGPDPAPQSNPLGVAGFITSLVGLVLGLPTCGLLSFIALIGLGISVVAMFWQPRAFAAAGIVIGVVGTLPMALWGVAWWKHDPTAPVAAPSIIAEEVAEAIPTEDVSTLQILPFKALNIVPRDRFSSNVSVAEFSLNGPNPATIVPTDSKLNQVAWDEKSQKLFGIRDHEFGRVADDGTFTRINVPELLGGRMSWATGVAHVPEQGAIIITSRNKTFAYHDDSGEWELLENFEQAGVDAIAYDTERDVIFGLVSEPLESEGTFTLVRLSAIGAVIDEVQLSHTLPVTDDTPVQLVYASGRLVVLVAANRDEERKRMRIFLVDPETGEVTRPGGE